LRALHSISEVEDSVATVKSKFARFAFLSKS